MTHTRKIHRGLMCLMMLIIALPLTPAQSQAEGWEHGCDSAAVSAIAATTSQLDYEAMCQGYSDCHYTLCWLEAPLAAESACEDELCHTRVWLYAAAVRILEPNLMWFNPEADKLPDLLISALDAFEAGDYAAAQDIYQSIPYEVSFHPLLKLSAGLAAEANGDDAAALALYDESATRGETYPIVFYVRGSLFARWGQSEAAAADFGTFRKYIASDTELDATAETVAEAYPISDLPFEAWLAYPVLVFGTGPGGDGAGDLTLMPPNPVRMARIEDGARLVVESTTGFSLFAHGAPHYLLLSQNDNGVHHTRNVLTNGYQDEGGDIQFDLTSQPATGTESWLVFESRGSAYNLLAPEGQPDPRDQLDVFRCEGGAITRLKVGEQGYSLGFRGVPMMDAPAGHATGAVAGDAITESREFTVLQGPECRTDQAWWQVENDFDGAVGWIAENEAFRYLVLPIECPTSYADVASCMPLAATQVAD